MKNTDMNKEVLNWHFQKKIVTTMNYTDCKCEHQVLMNTIKKSNQRWNKKVSDWWDSPEYDFKYWKDESKSKINLYILWPNVLTRQCLLKSLHIMPQLIKKYTQM